MFCQSWIDRNNRTASDGIAVAVVIEVLPLKSTSLEHHLILSQCPGLVAEHELDLAELLGDVEGPALGALVVDRVVHQLVVVDQINLDQLCYLYCNIQRQWNNDLKQEKVSNNKLVYMQHFYLKYDDECPESKEANTKSTLLLKLFIGKTKKMRR